MKKFIVAFWLCHEGDAAPENLSCVKRLLLSLTKW